MRISFQQILPVILFFPVAVIQLTIIPFLQFDYVTPDLVLILLVYFTLQQGQLYGTILGFIFGFLFDIISGGLLGSSMFAKTLAGFIAGYFYNENKIDRNVGSYFFVVVVFAAALIDSFFYALFGSAETSRNIFGIVFRHSFLSGTYTALISLIIVIFKPSKRFQ